MNEIFVSIAAYRDPELVPTVEDCLAKAVHPERLRFGICWQHGPDETALPWSADPRFRILDVDWRTSRGACWARAEIMHQYHGEAYYLQLDSHHRFADAWDDRVLDQLHRTNSPKPLITTYGTPYNPQSSDPPCGVPMQMNFDGFTRDGIPIFRPGELHAWQTRTQPARARFLSAHLLFCHGTFVEEVPYDPSLYFVGEEITLAVRAFTHGYDLFHPSEIIVWHEYSREYRPHKHWTDHTDANDVAVAWHHREQLSVGTVRGILSGARMGPLGVGAVRSLADYERYTGVNFRTRAVDELTARDEEPPPFTI